MAEVERRQKKEEAMKREGVNGTLDSSEGEIPWTIKERWRRFLLRTAPPVFKVLVPGSPDSENTTDYIFLRNFE